MKDILPDFGVLDNTPELLTRNMKLLYLAWTDGLVASNRQELCVVPCLTSQFSYDSEDSQYTLGSASMSADVLLRSAHLA